MNPFERWSPERQKLSSKVLIVIGLANFVQLCIWMILAPMFGIKVEYWVYIIFALLYVMSAVVTYEGNYRKGRAIAMVAVLGHMAVLSLWQFGRQAYTHYWVFPAIAAIYMVFDRNEKLPKRMGTFALFLLFLVVESPWIEIVPVSPLPPEMLRTSQLYVGTSILFVTYLLIRIYMLQIDTTENALNEAFKKNEQLLNNALPHSIALRLKAGEEQISDHVESATVMFCDMVGFTNWSAQRPARQVVKTLNQIYSKWDDMAESMGIEKIKTIGDAYMAAAGVPDPDPEHAQKMAHFAQAILRSIDRTSNSFYQLELRIGMHSGPLNAGVIGRTKFSYDMWGDTVNTASRLESYGEPGKIQISSTTKALLGPEFVVQSAGTKEIKGIGQIETWWLGSKDN